MRRVVQGPVNAKPCGCSSLTWLSQHHPAHRSHQVVRMSSLAALLGNQTEPSVRALQATRSSAQRTNPAPPLANRAPRDRTDLPRGQIEAPSDQIVAPSDHIEYLEDELQCSMADILRALLVAAAILLLRQSQSLNSFPCWSNKTLGQFCTHRRE
jgi:hypothetical protein